MSANKSLAEPDIFCKAWAMGNTPFFRRFATPLCAIALLCSVHGSFAQSPPENPSLIGKWELFSESGIETTIPREVIEFTADALEITEDCRKQSYTYTIENGEMTAKPPALILLMSCNDRRTQLIQDFIVAAITSSKIQLSGDALVLEPLTQSLYSRKLEFHRTK